MIHAARMTLAAILLAGFADAAIAQGISLSPDGEELVVATAQDQACLQRWLDRTISDRSARSREVTVDCAPPVLGPNDPLPPARVTLILSRTRARCISDLIARRVLPPFRLSTIQNACGPRLIARR
jgi:hypothetical protein